MTRLKFLWIDDLESRRALSDALEGHSYVHLPTGKKVEAESQFLFVRNKDAVSEVSSALAKKKYDLVIVDHFLIKATGLTQRGSTLASIIREKVVHRPIVGVTGANRLSEIDSQDQMAYDELISVDAAGDSFDQLYSISIAFKEMTAVRKWSTNQVLAQLRTPDSDKATLSSIAPKFDTSRIEFVRSFYRWTRSELMGNPGFLYDRAWISNMLGLRQESFKKVEKLFDNAKYKGIGCTAAQERWWKSSVKEILFSAVTAKDLTLPWQLGRFLSGIGPTDFSKCTRCKLEYPETMGYIDRSKKPKLVPLHFRCSDIDSQWTKRLYFEDRRLMKDGK